MADAKIKKIIGNVTKLIFSRIYREYVIFTWKTGYSSNFIFIYDFNEIIMKYEFTQINLTLWRHTDVTLRHGDKQTIPR